MRKVLSALLATTMLATTLVGCTNTSTPTPTTAGTEAATTGGSTGTTPAATGDPVTLKLSIFKGGYGDAFWVAATEAFTKQNPNVTFEIDCDPSIGDKVNSAMIAGDVPDFIYSPTSNPSGLAQRLIKDKALADITDVFESPELKGKILDGFLDTSLSQPYHDGKVYLAPLYYTANGLFYNATLFAEEKIEVPKTWDEFFKLGDDIKGKQIAGKDRALFTYQGGNAPGYMETVIVPLLVSKLGADAMDKCFNYEKGAWDNDAVREVFGTVAKIGTGGYLMNGTTGIDHTTAQTSVMNGSALFVPCGSWIVGEMKDIIGEEVNGKAFEWGYAPVPAYSVNDPKYLMSSVEEVYIPKDSKNVDVAKEFLKFLYSEEAIKLNAQTTGGIPPVVGATSIAKDILDPMILSTFKAFDDGYMPYIGGFAAVDSEVIPKQEFYGNVNDVVDGKKSVDEWIASSEKVSDAVRDTIVTAE